MGKTIIAVNTNGNMKTKIHMRIDDTNDKTITIGAMVAAQSGTFANLI